MHLLWFQTGYRPPFVHPDEIPAVMVAGAAFTLLFETGFILLVLFRRTRPLAALAGLAFHNSTYYTMQISFWQLQFMYVSLIDWERISNWMFARRPGLTFAYDGNCGVCKRTVAVLQTIAFPGSVAFVNALDEGAIARAGVRAVEQRRLLSDIHVFVADDVFVGYEAYRRLAWRSPILWPLVPVLALAPVRSVGNRVYRRVADHRSCAVSVAPSEAVRKRRVRTAPLVVGCTGLLAVLFALGTTGLRDFQANRNAVAGWPLAIFPTFAGVGDQTTRILSLRAQTNDGTTTAIDLSKSLAFMSSGRRAGLISSIVGERDPRRRDRELRALLNYARADGRRVQQVAILEQRVSIDPSQMGRVLESRPLMHIGA
jgi:predicted DCC family thiol-disulfide oxidoreductase YuxK